MAREFGEHSGQTPTLWVNDLDLIRSLCAFVDSMQFTFSVIRKMGFVRWRIVLRFFLERVREMYLRFERFRASSPASTAISESCEEIEIAQANEFD